MKKRLTKIALAVLAFLFVLSISVASAQTTTTNDTASKYEKAKQEWQTLRNTLRNKVKSQITTEEKGQGLEKAKEMVSKSIDRTIARLSRIITRIQKIKVITEERKTKLIADLQAQITLLENLKDKVDATTTKDELKTVVGDVKNRFVSIREIVKKMVAEILASHIDKTIAKLNTIVSKLETEIANLEAQGQDVTEFEKTLTEAKDLITQAETKNDAGEYKEARRLVEQVRTKLVKLAGEIKAAQAKLKGGESESE